MDYSVMCPSCLHTITVETRSFEIAYPLDYESRIKKYFSDSCRKCGEAFDMTRAKARSGNPEAGALEKR